jgi:hypothetical protein
LLWFQPGLRGRISHDARAEILPLGFLRDLAVAYAAPDLAQSRALLERYDVVVVDRGEHPRLFESLSRDPRWASLTDDRHASAFVRR